MQADKLCQEQGRDHFGCRITRERQASKPGDVLAESGEDGIVMMMEKGMVDCLLNEGFPALFEQRELKNHIMVIESR